MWSVQNPNVLKVLNLRNSIAFNWILTIMHFLSCSSGRNYRVYVGKHDLSVNEEGSMAISAQNIIVHEKWNSMFVALG